MPTKVQRFIILLSLLTAPILFAQAAKPEASNDPAAEKLWEEVLEISKPPSPPADWQGVPTPEQQEQFKAILAERAGAAADKAREFYTKYPDHPRAAEAQQREKVMLSQAVRFGAADRIQQLEQSPALTPDEKFEAEVNELDRRARARESEGLEAVLEEFEKGTRELMEKYPDRPDTWQLLLLIASNSSNQEKSKALFKEITASADVPEAIKERAMAALKTMEALGQPLELSFTALDGRKVDLQDMDGKVVLIDFWATWCGPCIQELPNVKRAYEQLHPRGFEIVGISFDQSKDDLEQFVKAEEMPWPQYFDGQGWGNKFGKQFNITAIPAMWLVDKKGVLRDLNARADLEAKVEKLLAEK